VSSQISDPIEPDAKKKFQRLSASFPAFNIDFYREAISILEKLAETDRHGVQQSIGVWFQYYRFLTEVILKFDEAVTVLMGLWNKLPSSDNSTQRPLTEQEDASRPFLPKYSALYRTEAFYIFAKILLDRIAESYAHYFDEPLHARGSTHTKLVKEAKQHPVLHEKNPQFIETMEDLQKRVTTFRDKAIEHTEESGFVWGIMPDDDTCQIIGFPVKDGKNPRLSEPLLSLLKDLENIC
jgi:hypothetical protein